MQTFGESQGTAGLAGLRVDATLDATLREISQLAVLHVAGCALAGITLIRDGAPVTAAFTDPEAPDIDVTQYETGDGPCLSAFRENRPFRIPDTRTTTRWQAFAATAAEHGVLSTLSLPLIVGSNALGALNLYSREVDQFADDDAGAVFALQAAVVLANSQAYWAAQTLATQLSEALESRAVIEQAKGIVMHRDGCDPDTAFARLRAESQRTNRKLRDVAAALVADPSSGLP